jgi:hypothetical protein
MPTRKTRRLKPVKMPSKEYRAIWRVVDGAVRNAFDMHPDYLTEKGLKYSMARMSVVKRVTGAILGFTAERQKKARSGASSRRAK